MFNTASNWVVIAIAANFCIVISLVAGGALKDKMESFSVAMLKIAMISIITTVVSLAFAFIVSSSFSNQSVSSSSYLNRIAHQETVKPYRYYLDGDKLYYQLSKDGKQSTDKIDHKTIEMSDHKRGTAVYGKKWVADKDASKVERQLVKRQEIQWYRVTYKQGSVSNENN